MQVGATGSVQMMGEVDALLSCATVAAGVAETAKQIATPRTECRLDIAGGCIKTLQIG